MQHHAILFLGKQYWHPLTCDTPARLSSTWAFSASCLVSWQCCAAQRQGLMRCRCQNVRMTPLQSSPPCDAVRTRDTLLRNAARDAARRDLPINELFYNLETRAVEDWPLHHRILSRYRASASILLSSLQDAARRDLTINALFYNLETRAVEDFTGRGLEDMRAGVIRTPLQPRETFMDGETIWRGLTVEMLGEKEGCAHW